MRPSEADESPDEQAGRAAAREHDTVFGSVLLARRPARSDDLRAWDAADDLLLSELHAAVGTDPVDVLVVNDRFGALALPLARAGHQVVVFGDSRVAELAIAENARRSGIDPNALTFVASTSVLEAPAGRFGAGVWRIPRALDAFDEQLDQLGQVFAAGAAVMVGGMDRHTPPRVSERALALGTVTLVPRQHKARVFRLTPERREPAPPHVTERQIDVDIGARRVRMSGRPFVFGASKLDRGSALLLRELPSFAAERIADLGCGTGVLGIAAACHNSRAHVTFFDESYAAIDAAKRNWASNLPGRLGRFDVRDCLDGYDGEPFDLVVCNPPFHQDQVIGDEIAWRMFSQSHRHLSDGGRLLIVGNRHLAYHAKLRKIFGNCTHLADDPAFAVLAATRVRHAHRLTPR